VADLQINSNKKPEEEKQGELVQNYRADIGMLKSQKTVSSTHMIEISDRAENDPEIKSYLERAVSQEIQIGSSSLHEEIAAQNKEAG
jgi:hypothetical protein